jgi:small subunit ribosomal protein S6
VRRYETIFILRPDLGENQVKLSLKRVEDIVANGGGELIETDEWGVRELAYRIKRERRGYYVRLDYVATGAVMNEVERNLKLMDESLRHLSVLVQEQADAAQLRGEVEARRRRLADARAAASAPADHPAAESPPAIEAVEIAEEAAGGPVGEPQAAASEAQVVEPVEAEQGGESTPQSEAGNGTDQN